MSNIKYPERPANCVFCHKELFYHGDSRYESEVAIEYGEGKNRLDFLEYAHKRCAELYFSFGRNRNDLVETEETIKLLEEAAKICEFMCLANEMRWSPSEHIARRFALHDAAKEIRLAGRRLLMTEKFNEEFAKQSWKRFRFSFAWYDLWVGVFYSRKKRVWYICLLPTLVLSIFRKTKEVKEASQS